MIVEHIGYTVENPIEAADWYVKHLGFTIVRKKGEPAHTRFLADSDGTTVLEIYRNPKVKPPDYRTVDPLLLHLAVKSEDVTGERDRLVKAGAWPEGEIEITEEGDTLALLRDPWGFPLQLANRASPFT